MASSAQAVSQPPWELTLREGRDIGWERQVGVVRTTHWVERRPLAWYETIYDHTGATLEQVLAWVHVQEADSDGVWEVAVLTRIGEGPHDRGAITVYGSNPLNDEKALAMLRDSSTY